MKKNITKVLIGFTIIFSVMGLSACQSENENIPTENTQIETTESVTSESPTVPMETEIKRAEDSTANSDPTSTQMKRVGKEHHGYIDIPVDWVNFNDVGVSDDTTTIQYSDVLGENIITLSSAENPEGDPEMVLSAISEDMVNNGAEDISGATVSLNGIDAKQLYGYYPADGVFQVSWAFKSDDGYMHIIIAEGPIASVMDTVGYIETSYSLTE